MQVTFMDKTKVLGMQVLLNDIYHASEIDEVSPSATHGVRSSWGGAPLQLSPSCFFFIGSFPCQANVSTKD